MQERNIDQLVLGCTHYPFFIPVIHEVTQNKIQVINTSWAVAKRVDELLDKFELKAQNPQVSTNRFFTNGDEGIMRKFINQISLGRNYEILKKRL